MPKFPEFSLQDCLERFNRKERNLLIRQALGDAKTRLGLDSDFLSLLTKELSIQGPEGQTVAWWTDYHFNWIAGALRLFAEQKDIPKTEELSNSVFEGHLIQHNQEDVDLVVSFSTTIILIEAKAYSPEKPTQYDSKLKRFSRLKSYSETLQFPCNAEIKFHDICISRHAEKPAKCIAPHWVRLDIEDVARKLDVRRTTEAGEHWVIKPAKQLRTPHDSKAPSKALQRQTRIW